MKTKDKILLIIDLAISLPLSIVGIIINEYWMVATAQIILVGLGLVFLFKRREVKDV